MAHVLARLDLWAQLVNLRRRLCRPGRISGCLHLPHGHHDGNHGLPRFEQPTLSGSQERFLQPNVGIRYSTAWSYSWGFREGHRHGGQPVAGLMAYDGDDHGLGASQWLTSQLDELTIAVDWIGNRHHGVLSLFHRCVSAPGQ